MRGWIPARTALTYLLTLPPGLYDLIGNVWEWTHGRYYERLISRDLQGQMHTLKGGSFVDSVDGEVNLAVRNGQR